MEKRLKTLIFDERKIGKTWFVDLDGTIFQHNSYLEGKNIILKNAKLFLEKIPNDDCLIFVTARPKKLKKMTLKTLHEMGISFDGIIFNVTTGTRILINDKKRNNKKTCIAVNKKRNSSYFPEFLLKKLNNFSLIELWKKYFFKINYY